MAELKFTGNLQPGDVLVIDTERMSALLNGENARHLLEGDYPVIYPEGGFEYSDTESERTIKIRIIYKDRWL